MPVQEQRDLKQKMRWLYSDFGYTSAYSTALN